LALANCRSLNGLDLAHGQVGREQRPLAAMPIAEIEKARSSRPSVQPSARVRSKRPVDVKSCQFIAFAEVRNVPLHPLACCLDVQIRDRSGDGLVPSSRRSTFARGGAI